MDSTVFYSRNTPRHDWQFLVERRRTFTDEELAVIAEERTSWARERGYSAYQVGVVCQDADDNLVWQLPRNANVRVLMR